MFNFSKFRIRVHPSGQLAHRKPISHSQKIQALFSQPRISLFVQRCRFKIGKKISALDFGSRALEKILPRSCLPIASWGKKCTVQWAMGMGRRKRRKEELSKRGRTKRRRRGCFAAVAKKLASIKPASLPPSSLFGWPPVKAPACACSLSLRHADRPTDRKPKES